MPCEGAGMQRRCVHDASELRRARADVRAGGRRELLRGDGVAGRKVQAEQ